MTALSVGLRALCHPRVPHVVVHRSAATTTCAPPPLKTLYSCRSYSAAEQASSALSPLPQKAVRAVALRARPSATQLVAALPSTLMTQVVLWRSARTACASAAAGLCASVEGTGTAATVPAVFVERQRRRWMQCRSRRSRRSLGKVGAYSPSAATPPPACVTALIAGSLRRVLFATDGAVECVLSRLPAAASLGLSAPLGAAAAAGAPTLGSLRISRRYYGSLTAGARPELPAGAEARAQPRSPPAEEGVDGVCAPPAFAEVYAAFCALRLVDADGRAVRAWTVADIKRAYRALAKEMHPDVVGDSGTGMENVNGAYACLTSLTAEVADNYRAWLDNGGEAEMRDRGAAALRWVSRDVVELMMVGWCATFSGLAAYASWWMLCGPAATVSGSTAGVGGVGGKLTLPRAGAALSMAPGVWYGVVSSGGSFFMSPGLSRQGVQLVRAAMSRYALAVALTVAACANTVMLQRVLARLLTGTT
ncbi:DNAJ-domain transmembrane-like protein [Leptomonas pyrrhocoris]|uniref:DNAJ-domain transmembrane-like protein n=1 Tax=Leptomonas pyrrhocoris TaxID=157538 RepID=A0A0M9FR32_LEPPY|nr:DNAJ-domain transmembrane-like protein [Leptomonas pyrrhocoris]KPA74287.1 DNAJ-domain transmembrane-like protein [Leptomonas pyrrhocoris]|eukprot:XP_015652726.1 DNAJ-domain transmembrane-like protein [Leptomonas pyrrhocoris]